MDTRSHPASGKRPDTAGMLPRWQTSTETRAKSSEMAGEALPYTTARGLLKQPYKQEIARPEFTIPLNMQADYTQDFHFPSSPLDYRPSRLRLLHFFSSLPSRAAPSAERSGQLRLLGAPKTRECLIRIGAGISDGPIANEVSSHPRARTMAWRGMPPPRRARRDGAVVAGYGCQGNSSVGWPVTQLE